MLKRKFPWIYSLALVVLLGAWSCADFNVIDRQTPEVDGDELTGEITAIDSGRSQIILRPTDGRRRDTTRAIRYDDRTQVIYRGRDYPVNALEVGDVVIVQLWNRDRDTFTNLIRVQQNVRDRDVARSGVGRERVEGTVESVDRRNGSFEIRERSGENIVVSVAPGAGRSIMDDLDRLRRGDRVIAEGRFLSRGRFEMDNLL